LTLVSRHKTTRKGMRQASVVTTLEKLQIQRAIVDKHKAIVQQRVQKATKVVK
jgi:hypothetical protein